MWANTCRCLDFNIETRCNQIGGNFDMKRKGFWSSTGHIVKSTPVVAPAEDNLAENHRCSRP